MEYVNIDSLTTEYQTSPGIREKLFSQYDATTPSDHIIATDELELIRGGDLVRSAREQGQALVPLRRASYIKETVNFPKRVILEVTSRCNATCTMCPRNAFTRVKQHMDTELCKRVITELSEVGISGLWLFNLGESLLHPDFFEILDHCRSVGNLGTIWLSTNGTIMQEKMRERILDKPVDILNYSVNSMSAEEFKKVSPNLSLGLSG